MRKSTFSTVLLAGITAAFLISSQTAFADPNLVGWWKLDEGIGSIAYDSAGDNNGTIYGAAWTTGQIDGALSFGAYDYVKTLNNIFTNAQLAGGATLSAWFKTGSSSYGCIADDEGYLALAVNFAASPDKVFATADGGTHKYYSSSDVNDNLWRHAAIVWDGINTATLYFDGVSQSSGLSGPPTPDSQDKPFTIGMHSTFAAYFNGSVDDVRVYDRGLSAEEIWQLFLEGSSRAVAPKPADGATGVDLNTVLGWWPGKDASSHDVYFGTNFNNVNDADVGSPEYMGNFDVNSWDPCGLDLMTTYYWRIDEVNEPNLWKGDVWSFSISPIIELSATQFDFATDIGGDNPDGQVLSIINSGAGTLNWTIDYDCSWLTVDPYSGSSTGETDDVNLAVDISGLNTGLYNCELTVVDPCAENSPQTVTVNLEILGPEIWLSDTQFNLFFPPEGGNPPDQILTIRNSGMLTLNWTIDYDCDWLDVYPTSGSSTGDINEVVLSVDTNGLDVDIYNCDLTISDPNAENSPQTVYVNLHPPCPGDVTDAVTGRIVCPPPIFCPPFDIYLWEGPNGTFDLTDLQALVYLLEDEGGPVSPIPAAALAGDVTGTVTGRTVSPPPPPFIIGFDIELWEGPDGKIDLADLQALQYLFEDEGGPYTCP